MAGLPGARPAVDKVSLLRRQGRNESKRAGNRHDGRLFRPGWSGERNVLVREPAQAEVETAYSWIRLVATVLLSSIGGVGMWSVVVVLPSVQAEFSAARGDASLPYTLTMICAAFGG